MMRDSDNFPLNRYFSAGEFSDSFRKEKAEWFAREGYADQLGGATPSDDDTNYTVLALKLIKKYGKNFTSDDVIEMWLSDLPVIVTCTAERIAYRNALCGLTPPQTATYKTRTGNGLARRFGAICLAISILPTQRRPPTWRGVMRVYPI